MTSKRRDTTENIPKVIPRVRRKKTSIWFDEDLWDWFIDWVKDNHTSTCHILEPFVYALKTGVAKIPRFSPLPKIELNLTIQREVLRARRRETIGDYPVYDDWGSHVRCHVCPRTPKWVVLYQEGWDKVVRVHCCGYHVRRYRRMRSYKGGFPKIRVKGLLKDR